MVRPARFERATYRFVVTWLLQRSQRLACRRIAWGCTGVAGNPHRVQRVALMRSIRKAKAFGLPTIPWTGQPG